MNLYHSNYVVNITRRMSRFDGGIIILNKPWTILKYFFLIVQLSLSDLIALELFFKSICRKNKFKRLKESDCGSGTRELP